MSSEAALKTEIIAEVLKEWEENSSPLLLSQLGLARLSAEARSFVHEQSISLKRFIRASLADTVRFVPMTRQGGGLAPVAKTEDLSDADLEQAYEHSRLRRPAVSKRIRFHPEIWRAFSEALPEGKRWLVDFSGSTPNLRLIGREEPTEASDLIVEPHETAASDTPDVPPDARAVKTAISEWARQKGVDLPRLEADSAPRENQPTRSNRAGEARAERTGEVIGFVEVLKALPRDQLAKLQFPGDVVLSILEATARR